MVNGAATHEARIESLQSAAAIAAAAGCKSAAAAEWVSVRGRFRAVHL